MTTLQTGTKVLIEATVEMTDGKDDTTLVRFKTSGCYWMDTSDLTVCEKEEEKPSEMFPHFPRANESFGSYLKRQISPETMNTQIATSTPEPQPIDLSNFCIDITDPVNAELLPGFKEWLRKTYWDQTYIYQGKYNGNWIGYISKPDYLTTLPDLQKQHPGVFEPQQNDEWRPNNGESKVEWTKQTEWNPEPQQIEVGDVVRTDEFSSDKPYFNNNRYMEGLFGKEGVVLKVQRQLVKVTAYEVKHEDDSDSWWWPTHACTLVRKGTPSFKAGQEVEWTNHSIWHKGHYVGKTRDGKYVVEVCDTVHSCVIVGENAIRPIPARPTVESELESQEFFDLMQTYRIAPMEDQQRVIRCFEAVKSWLLAWHQKHSGRVEVSVPTKEEILDYYRAMKHRKETPLDTDVFDTVRHFMTRKEQ